MIFPRLVLLILLSVITDVISSSGTDGCIDSDVDLRAKKDAFVRAIEAQCRLLKSPTFFCRNIRLLVSITSEPFWCTQRQFDRGFVDGPRRRVKRLAVDEDRYEGAGDGSLENLVENLNWDIFHVNKLKEERENEEVDKITGLATNEVDVSKDDVKVPSSRNEALDDRNRTYVVYPVSFISRNDSDLDIGPPTLRRENVTDRDRTRWSNGNGTTSWPGNITKIKFINGRPTSQHHHHHDDVVPPPLRNGVAPSVVHGYQVIQNLFLGLRLFLQQWNLLKSWVSPGMLVKSARQLAEWMGLMPSGEGGRMSKRKKKKKAAAIMKVVMALKMMKIVAISFLTAKVLAFKAMAAATAALTLALSVTFKKLPGGGVGGGGGGEKKAKTVVVSQGSKGGGGGGGWPEGWSGTEDIWDSGGGSGGWDSGGGSTASKGIMDGGWKADRRRKGLESRWKHRHSSTTEDPYEMTEEEFDRR